MAPVKPTPPSAQTLPNTADASDIQPMLHDGQPDWDAIAFDIFCSRCGYNLKTLTHPRCPECGLDLDWHRVLAQAAWRSDFLFEHHWRTRPIRSWLKTIWKSFCPGRFWRRVSIHDRIEAAPLWFLLAFSVVVFLILLHGLAGVGWLLTDKLFLKWFPLSFYTPSSPSRLEGLASIFRDIAETPFTDPTACLFAAIAVWLVLLAALALLCSLRQTLGRCRVRSIQILRVISYVSTPVLALTALWILASASALALLPLQIGLAAEITLIAALHAMPLVAFIVFLGFGLKRYLRLPRAWLLAIVTTLAASLFALTALMFFIVHGAPV